VLDDEADQLETLCRGLFLLGIRCLPARTEAEALATLEQASEGVELLLVDLTAPRKRGARLVERVRALRPELPVLVVAGLALSAEARALKARGVPILRKPFALEELERAIAAAVGRSSQQGGGA